MKSLIKMAAEHNLKTHKKAVGLFTFLPRRPLLTLRPHRGFETPNYNEPALALWYRCTSPLKRLLPALHALAQASACAKRVASASRHT